MGMSRGTILSSEWFSALIFSRSSMSSWTCLVGRGVKFKIFPFGTLCSVASKRIHRQIFSPDAQEKGELVAQGLFNFFGEFFPVEFPEICVAGWTRFWSFVEPSVWIDDYREMIEVQNCRRLLVSIYTERAVGELCLEKSSVKLRASSSTRIKNTRICYSPAFYLYIWKSMCISVLLNVFTCVLFIYLKVNVSFSSFQWTYL